MTSIPDDYLERVYAAVLGKLVGVYLGRPFELWTHERIVEAFGEINWYVNDKTGEPIVVVDDDVTGTFTFLRALDEHGCTTNITSEQIGKTWLNNIIQNRSVFWWGGIGISTEQTVFINLKKGIPAPDSGSGQRNGKIISEQIGAQIFIDGWALVSPGNPAQAVKLAEQAAKVSHDGIAVHSARFIAAMEAEAFLSSDIDHLLDTGLQYVPETSIVREVVKDMRQWAKEDRDWYKTRAQMDKEYGMARTDKFPGACHVIPNLAIVVLALIYGGNNFHLAMKIVNTAGADTDCNGGNIGCLVALINGMKSFEGEPDWRLPIADRAMISAADGGYAINDAARIAYDVVNMGRRLNGVPPLSPPKDGAHFFFTLPGSVQGFEVRDRTQAQFAKVEQGFDGDQPGLAVRLKGLKPDFPVEILTDTFTPPEAVKMRTYELHASPLIYSGQIVKAVVRSATDEPVNINLSIKVYNEEDTLNSVHGKSEWINPGKETVLTWRLPDTDGQPIQRVGIVVTAGQEPINGTVWLDSLTWNGSPRLTLKPPSTAVLKTTAGAGTGPLAISKCDLWRRAWVQAVNGWNIEFPTPFRIWQDYGEGMIAHGTRDWVDYQVACRGLTLHIGTPAGLAARVQGLRRYYALVFQSGGRVALVRSWDDEKVDLASAAYDWEVEKSYTMTLKVDGDKILGRIENGPELMAIDSTWSNGGIALVVNSGSISADRFDVDGLDDSTPSDQSGHHGVNGMH